MSRSLVFVALVIALPGARAQHAADAMPKFDIAGNCKAEVAAGAGIGETLASCTSEEESARDAIAPKWSSYSQADKATCLRETSTGGSPSYVELQTCLEMTGDAKPKE